MDIEKFKFKLKDWAINGLAYLLVIPTFFILIWALMVFVSVFAYWYQTGQWISVPATVAFYHWEDYPPSIEKFLPTSAPSTDFALWLAAPTSALGPHRIVSGVLNYLNFSIYLCLMLVIVYMALFWLMEWIKAEFFTD